MAKRIVGLLLALCLIVGLLPMMAMAEETAEAATATLELNSGTNPTPAKWAPKMTEGMAPVYAKTVDGLITTEGASAASYNLMAEWPVGGQPTLTMKDAYILNDCRNTLTNNNNNVAHSIIIGGSADFLILLKGNNTILGGSGFADGNTSAYKCPTGLVANNTGSLTVRGTGKNDSSLLIGNKGGNGVLNKYNALNIENTKFHVELYNTTNQYPQLGITMQYGNAAYADKNDLNVKNSDFAIKIGDYSGASSNPYASLALVMGGTDETYTADNTGDLFFQNSTVYFYRNSGSGQTTPLVRHGSGSTTTFDRCDMSNCYAWRVVFYYLPTVLNYDTCTYVPNSTGKVTDYAIADAGSAQSLRNLKMTHTCLAGEPVVLETESCSTKQITVTKCVVCDKELSREETELTDPSKIHTPGTKVELVDQRVGVIGTGTMSKYGLVPKSEGSNYYKPATGKYVFQNTCAVCGETWIEEEEFKPAMLFFLTSGKGSYYEAGGYYNYNTAEGNNSSSSYKPTVGIGPGQVKYYTTGEYDANNPGYSYMKALTDEAAIAAGNWNVKFEYPLYGDPILTLKDATIINNAGLWYGYAGYRDLAPLTIVLEGENNLEQRHSTTGCGPLTLQTNNDVTITGDGTLNLVSYGQGRGLAIMDGHLTLDNIDLTMTKANNFVGSTRGQAIGSKTAGSVTVNGGSITYLGYGKTSSTSKTDEETGVTTITNSFTAGHTSLLQGRNVTINGATITAVGTFASSDSASSGIYKGILYAAEDLTITESTLFLAHGFAYEKNDTDTYVANTFETDVLRCGGTLTLNYANGVTGQTANVYTYANAHIGATTTTYPSETVAINSVEDVIAAKTYVYLQIAPTKALTKFEGTAVTVEDDLTLEFAVDASKVPAGSIAYITRNGVTTELALTEAYLEGDYYVIPCTGISAKEMHDQVTVVVKDAEGNTITETKTDSVYDYVVRMLKGEKPEDMSDAKFAALKTILVDMLNYGAMAQIQFEHNTENLANKTLTPSEWTYATAEMAATPATPATVEGAEATVHLGTTFELNTNIAMLIAVEGNATSAKVYVDGEYKETVTATAYEGFVIFTFNGMNAADGRKDIKFEVYTGETLTLTVTDSLAGYVGRNVEAYPYLENLMKYCDSAAAYFNA